MTIQRFSTYSMHQTTLGDFNSVQARLAENQRKLSSGVTAERFQDLPGQVESFVSLESRLSKADMFIRNNTITSSRLNHAQNTITNVVDLVDDMENLITLRRNDASGQNLNFSQQMSSLRDALVQSVNTTFEGRYIFGGTETSRPPIQNDPFPANVIPGEPDDGYYQGSKQSLTARIQEGFEMEYAFRADDESFQKLFASINLSIIADGEDNDADMIAALDLMSEASDLLIAEQTRINANTVILDSVTTRHEEQKLYWQGLKESIINTDIVEVSTKVAMDQAVLQASFQAFSTINQLNLSDYLR